MDILEEQPAPVATHPANPGNSIRVEPATDPGLGRIWILTAIQTLPRPIDEVFPFFADAFNLEKLTPSFLRFHVVTPRPIAMRSGCEINYKLRVRGVPIRWKTFILDWDPPHRFVDNQERGPYALWHHTHSFTPSEDGQSTICKDTVLYRPKGWVLAPLINKVFVQRDVKNIFEYRFKQLESVFLQ
ncbi:MAG: SRPBCC family protein [Phycisphaerales bacterium]|nr:SRPBCC family protein [Phycisphaerales bacterium]